jgi:serine/threonine protein phosphatase 1
MKTSCSIPLHKLIPLNSTGRDFFIGDIHGEYNLLIKLLKKVDFDPNIDRLFSTGDVIDRGPDSYKCLLETQEKWFYPILGNHEKLLIDTSLGSYYWKSVWFENGGQWWQELSEQEKNRAVTIIHDNYALTMTIETDIGNIGIVHAEYPFKVWPLSREQPISTAQMSDMLTGQNIFKKRIHKTVKNITLIISGHSESNEAITLGNQMFINIRHGNKQNLTIFELQDPQQS